MADGYPHSPAPGQTDTSAEAAASIEPVTARVQRMVLTAIRSAGDTGLTANELSSTLTWIAPPCSLCTSELRRLGRIADSGQRRRNPNGKRAIVWVLKEVARG